MNENSPSKREKQSRFHFRLVTLLRLQPTITAQSKFAEKVAECAIKINSVVIERFGWL